MSRPILIAAQDMIWPIVGVARWWSTRGPRNCPLTGVLTDISRQTSSSLGLQVLVRVNEQIKWASRTHGPHARPAATPRASLTSTFPNPTSFVLTASDLGRSPSDFLARHPTLVRLRFSTYQAFTVPTVSLQHLRALWVTHSLRDCLTVPPLTIARAPVAHLRLRALPNFSSPDLDRVNPDAFPGLFSDIRTILALALSSDHLRRRWKPADLRAPLPAVAAAPALRLVDCGRKGAPLPRALLGKIGPRPARLQYIRWDVDGAPVTHVLEATHGAPLPFLRTRARGAEDDWTAGSVLAHVAGLDAYYTGVFRDNAMLHPCHVPRVKLASVYADVTFSMILTSQECFWNAAAPHEYFLTSPAFIHPPTRARPHSYRRVSLSISPPQCKRPTALTP
ncbi:hypothetical protein FB451DRAFT_1403323 [Mycena latifolia]|nr:hypothetical protein FB451DRAFT_1403323 [Mycena latifolia]